MLPRPRQRQEDHTFESTLLQLQPVSYETNVTTGGVALTCVQGTGCATHATTLSGLTMA